MKTTIPREMLWKDRATMKELFEIQLFNVLYEAYRHFSKEPMPFPMNEVDIFNEVGYQVTWLCFESRGGRQPDMDQFEREVYAHTGLKEHAMTVISLIRAVVLIVNNPPLNISKQTILELTKLNKESWCRWYVDSYVKRVRRSRFFFDEQFLPCEEIPVTPDEEKEEATTGKEEDEMCAKVPTYGPQVNKRRFSLDEIVEYAKENLSLDKSVYVQNMLYVLLSENGTKEERKKVNSITTYILNRDKPGTPVNQTQNNYYGPVYHGKGCNYFTDEQIKKALLACVGKDKVINNMRKWAGAYWCLRWKCNYPVDIREFCTKIKKLELGLPKELDCDYENIRRICKLSFMEYDPFGNTEVKVSKMDKDAYSWCREVANKLAEELGKTDPQKE